MIRFLGSVIRWFFVLAWLGLIVFFMLIRAHGEVAKQPNKPLDLPSYVNPHEYSAGTVVTVSVVHPQKGKTWTAVRWKPVMTPLLYDEGLLFCGDVSGKFAGLLSTDEVLLVFSRAREVARIDGPRPNIIACRNLELVQKTENQ